MIRQLSKFIRLKRNKADIEEHPRIELVSIHIPKTAGTSFEKTLRDVYGRNNVIRIENNRLTSPPSKLPGNIRVIHGHFKFADIAPLYNLDKTTPIITWVREPVERVISNYSYLQMILRDRIGKDQKYLNVFERMSKTLLEFAALQSERNRLSEFLEGLCLQDLFFVGIQDYFSEDLADLAKMLHWKTCKIYQHNRSQEQKIFVDEHVKEEIGRLNREDVTLYQEALRLRKKRRNRVSQNPTTTTE